MTDIIADISLTYLYLLLPRPFQKNNAPPTPIPSTPTPPDPNSPDPQLSRPQLLPTPPFDPNLRTPLPRPQFPRPHSPNPNSPDPNPPTFPGSTPFDPNPLTPINSSDPNSPLTSILPDPTLSTLTFCPKCPFAIWCLFVPNNHFSQEANCPEVPIHFSAHLFQCPNAHLPQVSNTPNSPYPPNVSLPQCPFAIVPIQRWARYLKIKSTVGSAVVLLSVLFKKSYRKKVLPYILLTFG